MGSTTLNRSTAGAPEGHHWSRQTLRSYSDLVLLWLSAAALVIALLFPPWVATLKYPEAPEAQRLLHHHAIWNTGFEGLGSRWKVNIDFPRLILEGLAAQVPIGALFLTLRKRP